LPYFVMEFIEGTPITSFVQQRNPDLSDRLKLFLKVCSAVDVAHQNHIIHRDIKPANVLVQQNGEPKLLDFGIAKLLRGGNDSDTTVAAERRLTPMYAAPEQTEGRSITVRTDVYSLGALLQELLTNQQLFKNVPAAKTERELKAHLDRIVRRAMEKEPLRRYPSVADLASDIEEYLNAASGTLGSQVSAFAIAPKARRRWYIAALNVSVTLAACILVLFRGKIGSSKNYLRTRSLAPAVSESSVDQGVHSIAVLPFELLGQNVNGELLGLGMADAV